MTKKIMILILLVLAFTIYWFYGRSSGSSTADIEGQQGIKITSIPPPAKAGKMWMFTLNVEGYNPSLYELRVDKPGWLTFDKDSMVFKGLVPTDTKEFSIKIEFIRSSDGKVVTVKEFKVPVILNYAKNAIDRNLDNEQKKIVLKLKPAYNKDINVNDFNDISDEPEGEVLGAKKTRAPETALFPFQDLVLGIGFVITGVFIWKLYFPIGRKSTVRVVKGRIRHAD